MFEKDKRIRELEKLIPSDQRTKNSDVGNIAKSIKKPITVDWDISEEENASSLPLSDVIDLCGDASYSRKKQLTTESQAILVDSSVGRKLYDSLILYTLRMNICENLNFRLLNSVVHSGGVKAVSHLTRNNCQENYSVSKMQ